MPNDNITISAEAFDKALHEVTYAISHLKKVEKELINSRKELLRSIQDEGE